ncbi:aldehyde dehydrogenase family protein, partial [Escherichia coli]|nr:aldehyde dehydrogenase family protein [Escherichia coli]
MRKCSMWLPVLFRFLVDSLATLGHRLAASGITSRMLSVDPATGQEIASTADANEADVDNAVMSAWRAFVSRRWAGRLPAERERILLRFADLV